MSKLDYSDNFDVSFEYKAIAVPKSHFHEILIGKFIFLSLIPLKMLGLSEMTNGLNFKSITDGLDFQHVVWFVL